jgi:hypothetical protein
MGKKYLYSSVRHNTIIQAPTPQFWDKIPDQTCTERELHRRCIFFDCMKLKEQNLVFHRKERTLGYLME